MPHPPQLSWLDRAPHPSGVWDRVDDAHRSLVIETLAQLMTKAVVAGRTEESAKE